MVEMYRGQRGVKEGKMAGDGAGGDFPFITSCKLL